MEIFLKIKIDTLFIKIFYNKYYYKIKIHLCSKITIKTNKNGICKTDIHN
jgi:hypothetical protein